VQPVATCRQSPYLHKPAIVIVTSFSLWRLAPTALATPVLIMTSFSLWRHSPLRAYVTDTIPRLIYKDFGTKSIYHNYFCVDRTSHCLFTFKISTSYLCHDMFGQCRADIVSKLKFWHRSISLAGSASGYKGPVGVECAVGRCIDAATVRHLSVGSSSSQMPHRSRHTCIYRSLR